MEKELQSRCSCGRCHQNDFETDDEEIFYSAVRMSVDDCAVTVVRDDGLEETFQEALDRLDCLLSGIEYEEECDDTDTTTKAADVLRATLEELGFDRAVTLLEKLNALSARN